MSSDVFGKALKDYQHNKKNTSLWIHNSYGEKEAMPVEIYFRTIRDMTPVELLAMEGCHGDILDIGAAAGCHSLVLQQRNMNITALDISKSATEVMRKRGIKKVIKADIFNYSGRQFNTLLLLMNGIGVAGTTDSLKQLLHVFERILKPGGHVLFDSSDVKYLYNKKTLPADHYYGEIDFRYEYNNEFSDWFKWLYVDQQKMHEIAFSCGFNAEVLLEQTNSNYLMRLTRL